MTEEKFPKGDYIAAKISIYERVLAGLVKSAPNAAEIELEVRDLVEHWRTSFAGDPILAKTGDQTMQSIFNPAD